MVDGNHDLIFMCFHGHAGNGRIGALAGGFVHEEVVPVTISVSACLRVFLPYGPS